jgi:phosphomannomutase
MTRRIALFDVDGTLTPARLNASAETLAFLAELRKTVPIAVVGGSDFPKQKEQLGERVLELFDYSFSENGLVAYRGAELLGRVSIRDYLTPAQCLEFVDFTLGYLRELRIPVKTGTFIEMRTGMFNLSPIGRNCTYEERLAFNALDGREGIRAKMCADFAARFAGWGLKFAIGGQISIDVFPEQWTKVYCLQFLDADFDEIHFFGDMIKPGGNDWEIAQDPRTIAHQVTGPADTLAQCRRVFLAADGE